MENAFKNNLWMLNKGGINNKQIPQYQKKEQQLILIQNLRMRNDLINRKINQINHIKDKEQLPVINSIKLPSFVSKEKKPQSFNIFLKNKLENYINKGQDKGSVLANQARQQLAKSRSR